MATFGERIIGAMKMETATFEEIERDGAAAGQAVAVIALVAVASAIGNMFRAGLSPILFNVAGALVGYVVWAALVFVIGVKMMPDPETRADFKQVFRVVGFAASPGVFYVLAVLPFLGPLIRFGVTIWTLIVMVTAVRQVLDYTDTFKAVVVCVLGFIGFLVTYVILMVPFGIMSWLIR